jgi:hypothetical protein
MDHTADESTTPVGPTLEREMNLVRQAIAMVASGASRRVVVGGLQFGEKLLVPARGLATEAGVRLVPLWMPDDAGADIAIERIDDE